MRFKELIFWILLFITVILIFSSCTPYNGSISEYDANNKLVVRYEFTSNQPMLMKAGDLKSDSRIKPLVESLMLELGYQKNTGEGYDYTDNSSWMNR